VSGVERPLAAVPPDGAEPAASQANGDLATAG
jgi:hypothetical protein